MERPTEEVELPVSGLKAIVFTYYLRGDRKAIESVMYNSAKFEQDEQGRPKLKRIDASYRSKMEDKAVLLGVKHFVTKDDELKEPTVDFIDNLPASDFEFLQQELPSDEPKKK